MLNDPPNRAPSFAAGDVPSNDDPRGPSRRHPDRGHNDMRRDRNIVAEGFDGTPELKLPTSLDAPPHLCSSHKTLDYGLNRSSTCNSYSSEVKYKDFRKLYLQKIDSVRQDSFSPLVQTSSAPFAFNGAYGARPPKSVRRTICPWVLVVTTPRTEYERQEAFMSSLLVGLFATILCSLWHPRTQRRPRLRRQRRLRRHLLPPLFTSPEVTIRYPHRE
jgi:hypothetical protein